MIGRQQPRVLVGDERLQLGVGPVAVGELFVHRGPRAGAAAPPVRYLRVLVHHVDDARVRLRGAGAYVVPAVIIENNL